MGCHVGSTFYDKNTHNIYKFLMKKKIAWMLTKLSDLSSAKISSNCQSTILCSNSTNSYLIQSRKSRIIALRRLTETTTKTMTTKTGTETASVIVDWHSFSSFATSIQRNTAQSTPHFTDDNSRSFSLAFSSTGLLPLTRKGSEIEFPCPLAGTRRTKLEKRSKAAGWKMRTTTVINQVIYSQIDKSGT